MSSVNHYSRDVNHTTALWWQHRQNDAVTNHPLPSETSVTWCMNQTQNDAAASSQDEPMSSNCTTHDTHHHHQLESLFEKSLTPSDVGKLNRLVIPKQHAEKYFPLNGSSSAVVSGGGDTAAAEKGMLLSFEDESGKCWRFRYSYWNSSQSYVLTKGWSRYVKEKHLDAGDFVFFQRHRSDRRRLFIGWRRRSGGGYDSAFVNTTPFSSGLATSTTPYRHLHHQVHGSSYAHSGVAATAEAQPPPTMAPSSRTVRLFGVNLECQLDVDDVAEATAEPPCHDGHGYAHSHHLYYYPPHLNISFTGDTMKEIGDRRG